MTPHAAAVAAFADLAAACIEGRFTDALEPRARLRELGFAVNFPASTACSELPEVSAFRQFLDARHRGDWRSGKVAVRELRVLGVSVCLKSSTK